ncbi:MAG TPA: Gfo/Idh/MocA family oxidoreductase, partial [Polyangiaceae bacterium]
VANPIEAHVDTTTRALERGKHVLVEKPIASTAREASLLMERAIDKRARLFVGHSERFHPVTRALAACLEGEQILGMAFRRIANGTPRDASLRTPMADALLNLAVHDIDLAAYLGRTDVELSTARRHGSVAAIELVAKSGWRATIESGRTTEQPERTLAVETTRASYRADLRAGTLIASVRATKENEPIALPTEEPLAAQATAIAAVLRGLSADVARASDGMRAVAVAEQALAAIDTPVGTAENL